MNHIYIRILRRRNERSPRIFFVGEFGKKLEEVCQDLAKLFIM